MPYDVLTPEEIIKELEKLGLDIGELLSSLSVADYCKLVQAISINGDELDGDR